jgi:hypothetical protein
VKAKAAIIFLLLMIPAYVMGGETEGEYFARGIYKSAHEDQ